MHLELRNFVRVLETRLRLVAVARAGNRELVPQMLENTRTLCNDVVMGQPVTPRFVCVGAVRISFKNMIVLQARSLKSMSVSSSTP